ncbi:carbonic anhydrase [Vineibacter terrae]|uniref:carbonic anhydrase n=1 Tax=Vineibacter terrae TaxID=2586908 RepID=A0A5C8PMU0_9HYPH|nr:carbonic anhydrase [Vineibacter terrae]TXL75744.1 carbonic anhydrase [Vineibacter terrae]
MCQQCELQGLRFSRRRMLGGSAALGGAMGIAAISSVAAWGKDVGAAPNAIAPDEAWKRLLDGNTRYVANNPTNKDFSAGRAARAQAQFPIAGIVSCADSRVAPELVFDQGPGEVFIVRVAGNFVNDDGLASLEYGVKFLGIPLLVVLGHSGCGAVDATIKVIKDKAALPGHLPALVAALKPGVEAAIAKKPGDLLPEAIAENVRHNVKRLMTARPVISALVASGKVKVVGGVYDIATGKVNLI